MQDFSQQIFNSPLDINHDVKVPWKWMPTVYLSKGLVYVVLFFVSLIVYKRLGLSNGEITFYTSWFLLPYIMRPILSIFVQSGHHNRHWILVTELLMTLSVAGIAYSLTRKSWLPSTMFFFWLIAFATIFHDIAIDKFSVKAIQHEHISSLRIFKLVFYRLALLIALGIVVMIAGNLEVVTRSIKSSWSSAFYIISGLLGFLLLIHVITLPRSQNGRRERKIRVSDMFYACLNTSADLIRTPRSWPGVLFLSFFLLPAILVSRISILFMIDLGSSGGLGLSPQEFGFAQGTVGVFGLMIGGIIGTLLIRRYGQKKILIPMALAVVVPSFIHIHLSFALPNSLTWIAIWSFIQQFAYGFGICAYFHYLVYYSEVKRFSTYALCMSLVSTATMIPVMISGALQEAFGYRMFFIITACCGITTLIVSAIVMMDSELNEKELESKHNDIKIK